MLLAIDVGNTHTVLGLFSGDSLVSSWRLQTNVRRTVDEYALQVLSLLESDGKRRESIHQIVMSCVVPSLSRVFAKIAQKYFQQEALIVGPGVKTGMVIKTDDPRKVGADRIVNALALREIYGAPGIVVDFGTATTFDVVGSDGCYHGGVIAPGILISSEALSEKAAQLPNIELKRPDRLIGKNTLDSMLSGIYYGSAALVEGILTRLHEELGSELRVIATGGLARTIAPESSFIEAVVPDLTLRGLRLIATLNEEAKS